MSDLPHTYEQALDELMQSYHKLEHAMTLAIAVSAELTIELGFCTFRLSKEEAIDLAVALVSAADGQLIDCLQDGKIEKWNTGSAFHRAYAAYPKRRF